MLTGFENYFTVLLASIFLMKLSLS